MESQVHECKDKNGIMEMDYEDVEYYDGIKLAQVMARLQKEGVLQPDLPHVKDVLEKRPVKRALGSRISERYERMRVTIASPALSSKAIWKVARAVEEGRVEEGRIEGILSRLESAQNRGAYFMACAKGAFAAVSLSWIEEEWEDA